MMNQFIVAKTFLSEPNHRSIQTGPNKSHFDKVIEMACLQRSVLPVVGKAQQLSCFRFERLIDAKLENRR